MSTPDIALHPLHTCLDGWEVCIGGSTVRFGVGAHTRVAEIARRLGAKRPIVVTDAGVRAAGRVDFMADAMRQEDLRVTVFDGVVENPTTAVVEAGREAAADHGADLLIGVGGGSALDTTKGMNFLLTNGGCMEDYWGSGKANLPMLPSIGIPTTAGTGSEAQRFALISRTQDHRKMACGDLKARFRFVLLDPEMTQTAPRQVRVATGLDAVTHAVESHVTRRRNPVSALYSRAAWRLLAPSYLQSIGPAPDAEVRARMLLGAHLAGAAIECSMLGAAHAAANPLTSRYGVTHGIAVGLLLPHVVRFNHEVAGSLYAELTGDLGAPRTSLETSLEEMLSGAGVSPRLRDHGIERDRLPSLASDASDQWTAQFNPRAVETSDLLRIYEAAY